MNGVLDSEVALKLSRLAAEFTDLDPDQDAALSSEQLLASLEMFGEMARVAADLQSDAVRSAHASGLSWAKIGQRLGISRQAVQQRFDPSYHSAVPPVGESRILGPVTRSEELEHLGAAGEQGWRIVKSYHGEHLMERDGQRWEVTRVSILTPRAMPAAKDGWQAASIRFPDCFYTRRLEQH